MSNIQVFQNSDKEIVKQKASQTLEKVLFENSNKKILLLLSGGSAFSILSSIIQGLSNCITVGVLDERYDLDPKINNFSQLMKTPFYLNAKEKGWKFVDTRIKNNETISDLTLRFEEKLKSWRKNNPDGQIFITQGMGPDGHTAGIMPYPEDKKLFDKLFEDEKNWVVSYDAGDKNKYPQRITATLPFLRIADVSIMFIAGKEKATILNKILSENISNNIFPASIIHEMKKVYLFTDTVIPA